MSISQQRCTLIEQAGNLSIWWLFLKERC